MTNGKCAGRGFGKPLTVLVVSILVVKPRVTVDFAAAIRPLSSAKSRSEEHTSELQSHLNLVCRLLLEKKKKKQTYHTNKNHIINKQTSTRTAYRHTFREQAKKNVTNTSSHIALHIHARTRYCHSECAK